MDKKHISIIGSCVSRHMFNNSLLSSIFEVDKYAYQICLWDLFGHNINLKKEDLMQFYKEEFTARMICYDLTKCTLSEIKSANSEYLMIDLYNVIENVSEFKFQNYSIFAQVSYDRYSLLLANLQNIKKLKGVSYANYSYKLIDESKIYAGLDKLAIWIKENFDTNKVIINVPAFSKQYYDINSELKEYDKNGLNVGIKILEQIKKFSLYLSSLLPSSKFLDLSDFNSISQFNSFDDIKRLIPPKMHYIDSNYIEFSERLCDILNINIKDYYTDSLSPIELECLKYRNLFLKFSKKQNVPNVILFISLSLNQYVSQIENLEDFIIIISAKDEASYSLKFFTQKEKLGLDLNIGYRESYIAVIDKSRNFIKEISSSEKIDFVYDNNLPFGEKIKISSAGFNSGNISSIILQNGEEPQELSMNKRGLNFVLLNAKTLEVVDRFRCDTHLDEELKINSIYLANAKIKI